MVEISKTHAVRSEVPPANIVNVVNGSYPKIYFNGFGLAGAVTDAVVIFQNGEAVVGAVQSSWPVLKEFARALTELVAENERQLGAQHIPLMEAASRLSRSEASGQSPSETK